MNTMHAMSAPADSDPGTADSHEVDQLTEQTYREVEASGVPVTVTDHGRPFMSSWCKTKPEVTISFEELF